MMNGKYLKWKSKRLNNRRWKPAKIWFCNALTDIDAINKLTSGEAGLTANAAVGRSNSEIGSPAPSTHTTSAWRTVRSSPPTARY